MTKTFRYILAAVVLLPLFSFSQKVENVHFEQVGKQVYIYYDLLGKDIYDITVYCSEDNGNTWGNPLQEVSGDVGNGIKPGNNKKVVWDVLIEKNNLTGNIKFKIKAENSKIIFVDPRDGQRYKTVKIGNQIWMAENLNYKTENSWCYDNDTANCEIYGRLYNWHAALKACPPGWHLPSDWEWKILEINFGLSQSRADNTGWRGADVSTKMKSTSGWRKNGNGTNYKGFNALPGGYRHSNGWFDHLSRSGRWWTSTEDIGTSAWSRRVDFDTGQEYRGSGSKAFGRSIRCVKN